VVANHVNISGYPLVQASAQSSDLSISKHRGSANPLGNLLQFWTCLDVFLLVNFILKNWVKGPMKALSSHLQYIPCSFETEIHNRNLSK